MNENISMRATYFTDAPHSRFVLFHRKNRCQCSVVSRIHCHNMLKWWNSFFLSHTGLGGTKIKRTLRSHAWLPLKSLHCKKSLRFYICFTQCIGAHINILAYHYQVSSYIKNRANYSTIVGNKTSVVLDNTHWHSGLWILCKLIIIWM